MAFLVRYGASASLLNPGTFSRAQAFYPQVLPLQPHGDVERFFGLNRQGIIDRYCRSHRKVNGAELGRVLGQRCRHLMWAGSDLLLVRGAHINRRMIVLETNSCPSGQKSMPPLETRECHGGYLRLARALFDPAAGGSTAVLYDKNPMEALGYASTLADHLQQPVFLVPFSEDDPVPPVRFGRGVMEVRDEAGGWQVIDRAFRYVTQRPWARLPLRTGTQLVNPVLACLAGGRNKLMAHRAYERLNVALYGTGLEVRTPVTFCDVELAHVGDVVAALGGKAVVKVPYSNAGQGIYFLTDATALAAFQRHPHVYDRFVVQELVDDVETSEGCLEKYVQIGTRRDEAGRRFAFDLRMLVCSGPQGFEPLAAYARRAPEPLGGDSDPSRRFATNLSSRDGRGGWNIDHSRLVPLGATKFDRLGLDLDDLVDAYVQTVLSVWAIEKMAQSLLDGQGDFRYEAFHELNGDVALLREVLPAPVRI